MANKPRFMFLVEELTFDSDVLGFNEEEEAAHWNGTGSVSFFVLQNVPGCFEIEVTDWDGCAGGLSETMGIEYAIEEDILVDDHKELKEGVNYTVSDIEVVWSRGDGWEIDDDVDYYPGELTSSWTFKERVGTKLFNLWWRQVICRIDAWRFW